MMRLDDEARRLKDGVTSFLPCTDGKSKTEDLSDKRDWILHTMTKSNSVLTNTRLSFVISKKNSHLDGL